MILRLLKYTEHFLFSNRIINLNEDKFPGYLVKSLDENESLPYAAEEAACYYNLLRKNQLSIEVDDKGAGSRKMENKRRITDIAKYSAASKKKIKFLSKLVYYKKPQKILELGTSLGVSAMAMKLSYPESFVKSIEGCKNTAKFTTKELSKYNFNNFEILNYEFKDFLLKDNDLYDLYDLIIIDGDHRYNASLELVDICRKKLTKNGCLIIEDINWSDDMIKAFNIIKQTSGFLIADFFDFALMLEGGKGYYRIKI